MLTPPSLKPGDLIRVVAPSSRFDRTRFDRGINLLKTLGYEVAFRDDIVESHDYLAGDDDRRAEEFKEALADADAAAIWCARGGYGAQRLYPLLDQLEVSSPKWLVGFSDITALHAWTRRRGYQTIHGPNITTLADAPQAARDETFDLMQETTWSGWSLKGEEDGPDEVQGRLVGGNLTVLASLMGSTEQPFFKNELLCLEDVGERPYRLDRSLEQLIQAGVLDGVAGVVLGNFQNCDERRDDQVVLSGQAIVAKRLRGLGIPVFEDGPFGHHTESRAFRHGELAKISRVSGGKFRAEPKLYMLPGVHA